jgi:imidazolonepropionase-like amidohydrolase
MKFLKLLTLFAVISFSLNAQNNSQRHLQEDTTYVINNVNIIPMTEGNKIIEDATVVIKENKIYSINNKSIPENSIVIEGKGKWLIPGLIDMHVHNLASSSPWVLYPTKGPLVNYDTQALMTLYVTNGSTIYNIVF